MTSHPYMYDITPIIFMTSYTIYIISLILLSWQHNNYTWHFTHYIWHQSHCISVMTPSVLMTSQQVFKSSHLAYIWHHTHLHEITLKIYDINAQYLWHHNHCIHDIMSPLYEITSMVYDISSPITMISHLLFVSQHPMYLFYQTPGKYDITSAICMKSYALHMTSHPPFMTSQLFIFDVKSTISDITSTISDLTPTVPASSPHPIDDITATICMISHPLYVWHPIHYIYDIIHYMYYITFLCVDDTTLGICMTSFAPQRTSHPLCHTKPQYLWRHVHFRHDITPTVWDIAPTLSLSSQPLHGYHTLFCMTSNPLYVGMDYI